MARIRSAMTLALAVLYLVSAFWKSGALENLDIILAVVVLGLSLADVSGTSRIIGYSFFIVSSVLLFYYRAPLDVWEQGLQENLYLVVMFTLVPLLSIPIRHGGYFENLQAFFKRYVDSNSRFYLLVSLISAFVGVLVNMAVVPLVHQISQASHGSADKKLLSSSISRGFATCTIWAPTTAAIGLILKVTGASWPLFFPFGLLMGAIAGLVGYVMTLFEERVKDPAEVPEPPALGEHLNWRKVIELSAFGLVLIAVVAIISLLTGIQTVIVVALVSLLFPVLWLGIIGRLRLLAREFTGDYFNESLPRLKNEIVLFLGAGLLATSITYSHLGNYVPQFLKLIVGHNALMFAAVVSFGSLVLSAFGVHPIILVTVIGSTVQAAAYGISPTFMALILAMGWSMGITVSPSAGTVIAISGLAEESPLYVGLRWNGPYAVISSAVLLAVMFALRGLGVLSI